MLSDPDTQPAPADWYLIASRGDLVLRLSQDLQIGEDGAGGIVLSPARQDALLRVSVHGSELTVQALALDWTFRDASGGTRAHQTFPTGTSVQLNFPTCSLTITPDFLAGERVVPDCVLDLRPITPPTVALTRLSEPITLVDQAAVMFQSLPPIGVATTEEIAALLEATSDDDAERLLGGDHDVPDETPIEIPVLHEAVIPDTPIRAPAPPSPEQPAATASGREHTTGTIDATAARAAKSRPRQVSRRTRSWHRPLAACLAALAIVAPMALLLDDPSAPGVRPPQSGFLEAGQSAEPVWPEDPPPEPTLATLPVPTIEPTVTVSGASVGSTPPADRLETAATRPFEVPLPQADQLPPEAAPAAATEGSGALSDEQAVQVAALLAEAQALFDAGAIVTPVHENAVGVLIRVLTLDPTNEAGLNLMYLSAVRLVEEAEAAHAAGNDYLARNLLEDVLGFHPEFEMARKLQEDWSADGNG